MKTFSITDTGMKRKMNQDYVYTCEKPVGNLPNLFIVADGMGGHNAGEYASRYAVETMIEEITNDTSTDPIAIIEHAIHRANDRLVERSKEDVHLLGMGTTMVVLTIMGQYLCVANVGDSRLYVMNTEIQQITKDHSLVEEMVRMGELDKVTAKIHPDRNIITRAIGVTNDVRVDFFEVKLEEQDQILMCSDGLTNMVDDDDIRKIIHGQRDIVEKAEKLVEKANDSGGSDNITVIVIEPFSGEVKTC
ncbi:Stp1/IreP family PP2C-type Ser/Thr phosphatase [Lachnospiraceae bacterium ZAX-1]